MNESHDCKDCAHSSVCAARSKFEYYKALIAKSEAGGRMNAYDSNGQEIAAFMTIPRCNQFTTFAALVKARREL